MASLAEGRTRSAKARKAKTRASSIRATTLSPRASASLSPRFKGSETFRPSSSAHSGRPTRYRLPSRTPSTPFPGMAWKSAASGRGTPRAWAASRIAWARGCSEIGGVEEPEPEGGLPGEEGGPQGPVHQDQVALLPVPPVHGGVRRRAPALEGQVLQDEEVLLRLPELGDGVQGAFHHDGPQEAGKELGGHPAVQVGVVPEGARQAFGNVELVGPGLPRGDLQEGVVHLGGMGRPCQWRLVGSERRFSRVRRTVSLGRTRRVGPGRLPPVGEEGGPLPRQGKRGGGGGKLQGEKAALAPQHLGLGEGRALGPGQAQDQAARRRLEKAPARQHAL